MNITILFITSFDKIENCFLSIELKQLQLKQTMLVSLVLTF